MGISRGGVGSRRKRGNGVALTRRLLGQLGEDMIDVCFEAHVRVGLKFEDVSRSGGEREE
jgi:hypothetical protein